jgi:hypothetical protein
MNMKLFALFVILGSLLWAFAQTSANSGASTTGQVARSSAQGSAARNQQMQNTDRVSTSRRFKHGRAHLRRNIPINQ